MPTDQVTFTVDRSHHRSVIALLIIMAASSACSYENVRAWAIAEAIGAVQNEMKAPFQGQLETAANTWGEGLFVFQKRDVSDAEFPVWLFMGDRAYALNSQAEELTPKIGPLREAAPEIRRAAGLENVPLVDIRREIVRQRVSDQ